MPATLPHACVKGWPNDPVISSVSTTEELKNVFPTLRLFPHYAGPLGEQGYSAINSNPDTSSCSKDKGPTWNTLLPETHSHLCRLSRGAGLQRGGRQQRHRFCERGLLPAGPHWPVWKPVQLRLEPHAVWAEPQGQPPDGVRGR